MIGCGRMASACGLASPWIDVWPQSGAVSARPSPPAARKLCPETSSSSPPGPCPVAWPPTTASCSMHPRSFTSFTVRIIDKNTMMSQWCHVGQQWTVCVKNTNVCSQVALWETMISIILECESQRDLTVSLLNLMEVQEQQIVWSLNENVKKSFGAQMRTWGLNCEVGFMLNQLTSGSEFFSPMKVDYVQDQRSAGINAPPTSQSDQSFLFENDITIHKKILRSSERRSWESQRRKSKFTKQHISLHLLDDFYKNDFSVWAS